MRKSDMIKIVQAQPHLWPQEEAWDADPLLRMGKPTTATLKRVIVGRGFRLLLPEMARMEGKGTKETDELPANQGANSANIKRGSVS
jgi:hypothetical protein